MPHVPAAAARFFHVVGGGGRGNPEGEPLAGLSAAEIYDLIVRLPVGYRTVFNLRVIEGMEHKEIAKSLGIAEGTSKSQLSKAKLLLQKMLVQKGIQYVKRKTR